MKVNTERLEEQVHELRVIAHRMLDIQDSVLRTSRILSRESIGEKFRIPILRAADSVEKRYEELMRMQNALRDIANLYERSEREITNEVEHANIHHANWEIGVIPIPNIRPVRPNSVLEPFLEPMGDVSDWIFDQARRSQEEREIRNIADRLRETLIPEFGRGWVPIPENPTPNPIDITEIFTNTESVNIEAAPDIADRLQETLTPEFGRGWVPITVNPMPDPIDVTEIFSNTENVSIEAAPGMDRVIESVTNPVGPGISPVLEYISGPVEILGDTILGDTGVIDWTPWNTEA